METKKTTPVESYISALKNYEKIGGNLSDAIILAETLLVESERQLMESYIKRIDVLESKLRYISGEYGNY